MEQNYYVKLKDGTTFALLNAEEGATNYDNAQRRYMRLTLDGSQSLEAVDNAFRKDGNLDKISNNVKATDGTLQTTEFDDYSIIARVSKETVFGDPTNNQPGVVAIVVDLCKKTLLEMQMETIIAQLATLGITL